MFKRFTKGIKYNKKGYDLNENYLIKFNISESLKWRLKLLPTNTRNSTVFGKRDGQQYVLFLLSSRCIQIAVIEYWK